MPLLNIGITLAIFILDGNTPVLNEILQMCARGLQITDTTFATVSMLISSKSEDLFLVHPVNSRDDLLLIYRFHKQTLFNA